MKLYLSSDKLGDQTDKLKKMVGDNKRVGVIINSRDGSDREEVLEGLRVEMGSLRELRLLPEILDLKMYFGKKDELSKELSKYGMVYVVGGNTFILRKAMKYSGFDELINERLSDKDFVYAGYSAGICVLAPTLRGLDLCDEPELTPEGYEKKTIWEGLGIIPYSIAPHYLSDHPESLAVENVVKYFEENNIPHKTLHDGEVIIESY